MGNKQSKVKSPYEILNVTPYNSLQEIKASYIKLIRNSPSYEINNAYSLIKESPPPLNIYNKLTDDVIEKINLFAKINCPLVSSNEFKTICKMLSRLNIDTFRNENDKQFFYFHLNRLIRQFKIDNQEIKVVEEKDIEKNIHVSNKSYGPFLKCINCNKEFKSINTIRDHYNSKKHKDKINNDVIHNDEVHKEIIIDVISNNESNISEINNDESNITEINNIEVHNNISEINNDVSKVHNGVNIKNNINVNINVKNNKIVNKLDHIIFRTCTHCKEIFKTRVQLLYHLRNSKH